SRYERFCCDHLGCRPNTMRVRRRHLVRFLCFLDAQAVHSCTAIAPRHLSRMVKIFERALRLEITSLPLLALRLVFRTTLTHTHRQYGRYRLRGRSDGLATPAFVYHGDRRSGTVVT